MSPPMGAVGDVRAMNWWDVDGPGPLRPHLVIAGDITSVRGTPVNRIAIQNELGDWAPIGLGFDNTVRAVTSWDPDGSGPASPTLIAAGVFSKSGGVTVNGIAGWDGLAWTSLAGSMNVGGSVYAMTTWDPDGDGPMHDCPVAGGAFDTAGGIAAVNVAWWDGVRWHALGAGTDGLVVALTTWDPDGEGPQAPSLIAAGDFTRADGKAIARVARWDGTSWQPLGLGFDILVRALCSWDADGSGPQPPTLIAGGEFSRSGTTSIRRIAQWNGTAWSQVGGGATNPVYSTTSWDPDGPGPTSPVLVMAGYSYLSASMACIGWWDGTAWHDLGGGLGGFSPRAYTTLADYTGDSPELIAGGSFDSADSQGCLNIARWAHSTWWNFGAFGGTPRQNMRLTNVATWDSDGPGGEPSKLIAVGYFVLAGDTAAHDIAAWDGISWNALGSGISSAAMPMCEWDPDDAGPAPNMLVVSRAPQSMLGSSIVLWDGQEWSAPQPGAPSNITDVLPWDPDGDGPLGSNLVVIGSFTSIGGVSAYHMAMWDGAQWSGFPTSQTLTFDDLAIWDPDGPGPLPRRLIAIASGLLDFDHPQFKGVAWWTGSAWAAIGSTFTSNTGLTNLISWDPDGNGPSPSALALIYSISGTQPKQGVAIWLGMDWQFSEFVEAPKRLLIADPDQSGVAPPSLVALKQAAVWWDGQQWNHLAYCPSIDDGTMWDPDGEGPQFPQIVVGGSFTSINGMPARGLMTLGTREPQIRSSPTDTMGVPGSTAAFEVMATECTGYQWRRDGVPLTDGHASEGSTISGSAGSLLVISRVGVADAATYDCVLTNSCGSVTTHPARLSICASDFDGSGFVDTEDFDAFVHAFEAGTDDADFDGSGFVDTDDFTAFVLAFEAGC